MHSRLLRAAVVAAALTLGLSLPVLAHSGDAASSISVEPAQVTAGGTVVLAGNGLEPDTDREIRLVGPDVVVPFPNATTDAEGMFTVTLTIPDHLPSGIYTFQAIGDETLTTELAVTAAAGMGAAEPKNEALATVQPRSRSSLEVGLLGLVIVLSIGLGAVLVLGAERVGRARREAPVSEGSTPPG